MAKLLIIDDDEAMRFALRKALTRLGHDVEEAAGGHEGLRKGRQSHFDVILLDLSMPDLEGQVVLEKLPKGARVIVLTGHGTVRAAVDAMRAGAYSFLEKPLDMDVLRPLLDDALSAASETVPEIVGVSPAVQQVRAFLARVAPSDETVAIFGETGTGKEVIAKNVHAQSLRKSGPFVACNMASIPRDLFESELFGHKKGAFTGAERDRLGLFREAENGTLFLDEVGELPLDMQAKLLRVLEERRVRGVGEAKETIVNARVVCATNRNLMQQVQEGKFREDLYFRLQVFPVTLTPLRKRSEDIPYLAQHFLRSQPKHVTLERDAEVQLMRYDWPGNVRELFNVLRRAVLFAEGGALTADDFQELVALRADPSSEFALPAVPPPGERSSEMERVAPLAELERQHIMQTYERMQNNVTKTAEVLGIDRRTLQRKLKSFGVTRLDDDG